MQSETGYKLMHYRRLTRWESF